jgi:hypothetical protein
MGGNDAKKFDRFFASVFKLVFFVFRNENDVASSERSFNVFTNHKAFAFQNVDFVFPWVVVIRTVPSCRHLKQPHCKVFGTHFLRDKPSHSQVGCAFLCVFRRNFCVMDDFQGIQLQTTVSLSVFK